MSLGIALISIEFMKSSLVFEAIGSHLHRRLRTTKAGDSGPGGDSGPRRAEKRPMQETCTGDSGPRRPETPARAKTPGLLRTNSGPLCSKCYPVEVFATKHDRPETPAPEPPETGDSGLEKQQQNSKPEMQ